MLGHTASQRRIFRFHDGVRDRRCDPLRAYRVLLRLLDGDLDGTWRLAVQARRQKIVEEGPEGEEKERSLPVSAEALDAEEALLAAARQAFGLPAFIDEPAERATEVGGESDGEGSLDMDVWRILHEFSAFMRKKKEDTEPLPTTSPPTQDSPPSSPENSPTGNTSG